MTSLDDASLVTAVFPLVSREDRRIAYFVLLLQLTFHDVFIATEQNVQLYAEVVQDESQTDGGDRVLGTETAHA